MKIYLDTLGCRLNQAEIEAMAGGFRAAGHDIVGPEEHADLSIINTCSVTANAASDSRNKIRRLAHTGHTRIIATGCWATLEPDKAMELPGVESVVTNARKDRLVSDTLNTSHHEVDGQPIVRTPLPGPRRRTRAFIKAQDGCDNQCAFCVSTIARGSSRSRPIAEVLCAVNSALDGGVQEVVLTGVHLGSWGQDLGTHLRCLIKAILAETKVPRLRLSSLEPWDLDEDFFSLWEEPRLCQHLHLPLQSGSRTILRQMRRRTTPASFRELVASARAMIPNAAITTDVIAGFPGESSQEFLESLDFVRHMDFAGGHTFAYSPRPGTIAAKRTDQIPPNIRKERNRLYLEAFHEASEVYRKRQLGLTKSVLWETSVRVDTDTWMLTGLTDNYLRVKTFSRFSHWNEIQLVKLRTLAPKAMLGELIQ